MIESTVISWLNANNITAYGEEPKNSYPNEYFSRDSFCVVQKTGGGVERRLRNGTESLTDTLNHPNHSFTRII